MFRYICRINFLNVHCIPSWENVSDNFADMIYRKATVIGNDNADPIAALARYIKLSWGVMERQYMPLEVCVNQRLRNDCRNRLLHYMADNWDSDEYNDEEITSMILTTLRLGPIPQ